MPNKKWVHNCEKRHGGKAWLGVEICPDCGQRGEYDGWGNSVIEAMCSYRHWTGLLPIGPHRALADELFRNRTKPCPICKEKGWIDINNGKRCEICPKCNGDGYYFDGSKEEFETIRNKILAAFPGADPDFPRDKPRFTSEELQNTYQGGVFLRPKDESLQAYKDFINGALQAIKGNDYKDTEAEQEWEKAWKRFWSKSKGNLESKN